MYSDLSQAQVQIVRGNFNMLIELAERPDPFRAADLPEHINHRMRGLQLQGLVERVGETDEPNIRDRQTLYSIPDPVREEIERQLDSAALAPCGHRGLHNLGDGFTCGAEWCHQEFARHVAADMLGVAADA